MNVTAPTYLTTDCLLQHPDFARSRDAHIEAILKLYETRPELIELMLDGGRIMVYGIIMALWGGYREDEISSLPTVGRLKQIVAWFDVASPRQVDHIVARFAQVGHIQISTAPHDLRARVLLPTLALIEHDRDFLRAHYLALGALFGQETYALPLSGNPSFLKAARAAWIATLETMAREIFAANRPILRFYASSAGMLMLMRLVHLHGQSPDGWVAIDYTDFGRRFGVSRTHVRTLFKAAAADGDIEIDARGFLRVGPELTAALDRNIAGRLSLLDRAHGTAMAHRPL